MRTGVWLTTGGDYTVWTAAHYFVASASGDSTTTNIYCGGSQIRYTDRGIARQQCIRFRQSGIGEPVFFHDYSMFSENAAHVLYEAPLEVNDSLFRPGTWVIESGVIYDSITEETGEYFLLSTCNGDQEKLFSDGRARGLLLNRATEKGEK